jgi:hypothetical protein
MYGFEQHAAIALVRVFFSFVPPQREMHSLRWWWQENSYCLTLHMANRKVERGCSGDEVEAERESHMRTWIWWDNEEL